MHLSTHARFSILALATLTLMALVACSQEPETVTVIKEVPVEKEVIREVPVEKIVEKIVEVVKEVEPTPEPETPAGPPIYQMGIFEEPISRNFWNYYGGPAGSVWTQYVLDGHSGSMYGYSDQRFDWVPGLAADFPTDLKKETVGDGEFWTAEVPLKTGVMWSDGRELDAGDFVFTVNAVLNLQLSSNWAAVVDRAFLDHVEAPDSHRLKVFFKTTDEEGNPQTPGLSVWQFGLGFMPVLAEHYWAPIVEEAKGAGETEQQQEALFAHVPEGEPTLGGFTFSKWEPGAFFENNTDPNHYSMGTVVTEYANGAYSESNERTGHSVTTSEMPPVTRCWSTRSGPTSSPRYSASTGTRTRRSWPLPRETSTTSSIH